MRIIRLTHHLPVHTLPSLGMPVVSVRRMSVLRMCRRMCRPVGVGVLGGGGRGVATGRGVGGTVGTAVKVANMTGVKLAVTVAVTVALGVRVGVLVAVNVGEGVLVGILVLVGNGRGVLVDRAVAVGVFTDGVGDAVNICVGDDVAVGVNVLICVGLGVIVGCGIGMGGDVNVGTGVEVEVGMCVLARALAVRGVLVTDGNAVESVACRSALRSVGVCSLIETPCLLVMASALSILGYPLALYAFYPAAHKAGHLSVSTDHRHRARSLPIRRLCYALDTAHQATRYSAAPSLCRPANRVWTCWLVLSIRAGRHSSHHRH